MYRKILIPLDGSDVAENSIQYVKKIAQKHRVSKVYLMEVLPQFRSVFRSRLSPHNLGLVAQMSESVTSKYLSQIAGELEKEGINVESVVVTGKPEEEISSFARNNHVDLIVMTAHGYGKSLKHDFGHIASNIISTAPVPVDLVKEPESVFRVKAVT